MEFMHLKIAKKSLQKTKVLKNIEKNIMTFALQKLIT